jgi:hypothetical protein
MRFAELLAPPILGDFADRREVAFFSHPRLSKSVKSWTISLGEGWGGLLKIVNWLQVKLLRV